MSGPWYQMPPRRDQAAFGGRPALILVIYIGGRATAKIEVLIERGIKNPSKTYENH